MNRKVLVIGIDGATWDIFKELIYKGFMPYLHNLMETGTYTTLKSTIPPISTAAWATVQTGIDSIDFGVYSFQCFDKEQKEIKIVNSNFLNDTIWDYLSKVGKRVAVVNVPMTYPPKKVNGFIVSGLLTPSIQSNFTFPPELKSKILKLIPDYQIKSEKLTKFIGSFDQLKRIIKNRIKEATDRTKICINLILNESIDILMVNFQSNDYLMHELWGYLDINHELFSENIRRFIFKTYYKHLDNSIKTIRELFLYKFNNSILTIIMSDHGFESHYKRFYLGDWLVKERFLFLKGDLLTKFVYNNFIKKLYFMNKKYEFLKKISLIFQNFRETIKKQEEPPIINRLLNILNYVDWNKSYLFSMGYNLYGLIFIFLTGENKKRLVDILKRKLYQVKDPKNNLKIIEKIYCKEKKYNAGMENKIPDLIIKPIKGYSINGEYKNVKNLIQKIHFSKDDIGKHNENGIIIIHDTLNNKSYKKIKNANLRDIFPTILNYFKLPLKKIFEGEILDYK